MGAADAIIALVVLSLAESSWGLWSSEVGGGFGHGQSWVGEDYGFCRTSSVGESCNCWVGFVLCLGPQMALQLCLAHPEIRCFYVKFITVFEQTTVLACSREMTLTLPYFHHSISSSLQLHVGNSDATAILPVMKITADQEGKSFIYSLKVLAHFGS